VHKREGKGLGYDAYHAEIKRTRLLVKKKRCCKGFVNDGKLGGGRQGGGASGATCSGDGTALGQREARVSIVHDEGKHKGGQRYFTADGELQQPAMSRRRKT
jgi:hypothetical protein